MRKIWKQRYRIEEKIGKGGNGQVYKVWDLHLEKVWAMKMLEEKYRGYAKKQREENQIDELGALKRISHPNFPRIVDAFEEEGRKVLIMDFVQGITLEEIIKKGALEEKKALQAAKQIGEAILYLHQQVPVLLYMDLKPSNIILEESGTIKLVDLGSVIVKGRKGEVSGTFGYASPEQIQLQKEGIFLKEQSDIFSFGLVLYSMVVGTCQRLPLVDLKNRSGIYVRKDNPFLSQNIEKIIEKCTRGNPKRRYGGMREVLFDLQYAEKCYGKRKKLFSFNFSGWSLGKTRWYQEKSILCTEGKHSFYIAKKMLLLFIGVLCLFPGKIIYAGENKMVREEMEFQELEPLKGESKKQKQESRPWGVIIRDSKFRKVLVKKGSSYYTKDALLLEIPWKEIEGEKCRILVKCQDEGAVEKQFLIECIYAK